MARVIEQAGVSVAPTGSTGVQVNEFEAAIKSVTSSADVGAVFLYDCRNDSDGGAWRKKCAGLSWYDEALNQTTRGGRREFPSVALIVADNAGSDATLKIYDLDDVAAPLWMSFTQTGAISWASGSAPTFSAVYALNGRVYLTGDDKVGLLEVNFAADDMRIGYSSAYVFTSGRDIASRNVTSAVATGGDGYVIVNDTVNDVAATVLEGAEIGALGLPIPTVAVATGAGTSVIHANGNVYDVDGGGSYHKNVSWDDDNTLFMQLSSNSTHTNLRVERKLLGQLYADSALANDSFVLNLTNSSWTATGAALGVSQTAFSNAGKNKFAQGGPSGLHLWKRAVGFDALNTAEPPNLNAYITSTYNTGYMLGDIKGAWLTGGDASADGRYDRSVGNTDLVENGTVLHAAAETDAEVTKYYDFSASNYFSQAHNSDFDFETGDFSIMFWCNLTSTSTTEAIIARYAPNDASPDWLLAKHSTNVIKFFTDGANAISTASAVSGRWAQVCVLRRGSSVEIYVDGKLDGSGTNAANLTNTSAVLGIGIIPTSSVSGPLASTSSLSLIRISATAPTPQQVKDIYEAEAPLFRAGAKCLLQSDSGVSPNGVEDLAFDDSTGLLHVAQRGNTVAESRFRGLEMVESVGHKNGVGGWDYADISIVAANAGVVASARTLGDNRGVITDLPPFDVRGDTNIADTKLPDDGKLHFTGVTSDGGSASPVTIGHIPIAEGECVTITAKVRGNEYNDVDGEYCYYEVSHSFYRDLGNNIDSPTSTLGDVIARTATITVSDESTASMEFVLEPAPLTGGPFATTGIPNKHRTVRLKCTGVANKRMQWNAEVEVQRISEKTYER